MVHRLFPHSNHPHRWEITWQCPFDQRDATASPMKVMWIDTVRLLRSYEHGWTVVLHLSVIFFSKFISDVVRVVFYLSITIDIILLQINNYLLEISYRFLEFVSHLAPSMSNILKCNEHQECLKTAKMGYFPMKMHDFPSIFVKSYYQQHITMEWDVPHLQHIQL